MAMHALINCTVVPVVTPIIGLKSLELFWYNPHTSSPSGAGWRLLYDEEALAGNVNPLIPGEEEKLIAERNICLE